MGNFYVHVCAAVLFCTDLPKRLLIIEAASGDEHGSPALASLWSPSAE